MKPAQKITGKVIRISIIREEMDNYSLSVLYCQKERHLVENHSSVIITRTKSGSFYLSNGVYIDKEKLEYQYTRRLKYEMARQEKLKDYCTMKQVNLNQAKNYQKQRQKVIRLQNKLYQKREDYLHKLTTQLVKKYQFIVVPNYGEARFLCDSFWLNFIEKLSYKCKGYGRTLQLIRLSKEEMHLSHIQQVVCITQQLKKV
ncbi:transposase [Enterococcus ureasiticus]|nr:transposase [Enterococcus ureasiticus]